jgi:hypothetical protein
MATHEHSTTESLHLRNIALSHVEAVNWSLENNNSIEESYFSRLLGKNLQK